MSNCPSCQTAIDSIAHTTYWVGWCRRDVHVGCFPYHVRVCLACREHNAELANHTPPENTSPAILTANARRDDHQTSGQTEQNQLERGDLPKDDPLLDPALND